MVLDRFSSSKLVFINGKQTASGLNQISRFHHASTSVICWPYFVYVGGYKRFTEVELDHGAPKGSYLTSHSINTRKWGHLTKLLVLPLPFSLTALLRKYLLIFFLEEKACTQLPLFMGWGFQRQGISLHLDFNKSDLISNHKISVAH